MSRMPIRRTPGLPDVFEGEIFKQVGKYARGSVLYAFEQVGGPDGLARWAADNPDDFYTKLFPKIITKEVEVHEQRGLDALMNVIDADYEVDGMDEADMPTRTGETWAPSCAVDPDFDSFDVDDVVGFEE